MCEAKQARSEFGKNRFLIILRGKLSMLQFVFCCSVSPGLHVHMFTKLLAVKLIQKTEVLK